jgi:hemerythrin
MALLKWKDQFSTGIEAVDHEHRELIELINRLHEELLAAPSQSSVEAFFGDLLKGIASHFALEEHFMRDRSYDALKEHKSDHERLLDEIRDIMDACLEAEKTDQTELALRLDAWFSRHFETHDSRLHRALGAHPH